MKYHYNLSSKNAFDYLHAIFQIKNGLRDTELAFL